MIGEADFILLSPSYLMKPIKKFWNHLNDPSIPILLELQRQLNPTKPVYEMQAYSYYILLAEVEYYPRVCIIQIIKRFFDKIS